MLVVAADGPYRTIHDFIASAKAYPNQINYSSSGVYGTLRVAMEMFASSAGIKLSYRSRHPMLCPTSSAPLSFFSSSKAAMSAPKISIEQSSGRPSAAPCPRRSGAMVS